MRWRKLGLIFCPDGSLATMRTHAAQPVPVKLGGDLYRIFFTARDPDNRGHIGFVDLDLNQPTRILQVAQEPALAPGPIGGFDDHGVSIGSIVEQGDRAYLYYVGWNLGTGALWHNSVGLAIGNIKAARFERYSGGPIIDRSIYDPYSLSYPWVLKGTGETWEMWHGTSIVPITQRERVQSVVRYRTSEDGVNWQSGTVSLSNDAVDLALFRPCVVKDSSRLSMWYTYRGLSYRDLIGYAESEDGKTWVRRDADGGLEPSPSGWDSEKVCYPCVFDHRGTRYMLYNGNRYGATGFGLAVLEGD